MGRASGIFGEYSFEKVFGLAIASGGDMTRALLQLASIDMALIHEVNHRRYLGLYLARACATSCA